MAEREVERRRREDRGAEGAEGVGCGEGGLGPQNFFFDLELKMVSFGTFWVAF